jgi:hypothetical protein
VLLSIAAKGNGARNCTSASTVAQRIILCMAIMDKATGSSTECGN